MKFIIEITEAKTIGYWWTVQDTDVNGYGISTTYGPEWAITQSTAKRKAERYAKQWRKDRERIQRRNKYDFNA
jgi:hypothetical protein